jgi:hypothetical protein
VVVILAISGFVYGIMIGIDLIWSVLTEHYAKLQRKRFAKTHVVMDVQNLDRVVIRYLDPYLIPDLSKIVCEYMYG